MPFSTNKAKIDFRFSLYFSLSVLAVGIVTVTIMAFSILSSIDQNRQQVARYSRSIALTMRLREIQASENAWTLRFLLTGDQKMISEIDREKKDFNDVISQFKEKTKDPSLLIFLNLIVRAKDDLSESAKESIQARLEGFDFQKNGDAMLKPARRKSYRLTALLQNFSNFEDEEMKNARVLSEAHISRDRNILIATFCIAALGFLMIASLLIRMAQNKYRQDQERDQLLAKMQIMSNAQREILETVAHDLKNPIGSIKLSVDLALAELSQPGRSIKDLLEITGRSAELMNRLVLDLLDNAKIESGHLRIEKQNCRISQLIDEVVERFRLSMEKKGVRLVNDTHGDLSYIWCDPIRIDQIFSNLLSNALKFTPPGGEVRISCEKTSEFMRISVKDTGNGMPTDIREKIFERYWQGAETAKKGTGLGLSISSAIAQAHDGKLSVESTLGVGSTFHLDLPLNSQPATVVMALN